MSYETPLSTYLAESSVSGRQPDPKFVSYLASLQQINAVAPEVARAIVSELADQRANLKMIASENYCSLAVQAAQGNLLTDKYAEGYPFHRFYAGCDNVDLVESLAASTAESLFGADHAYVQPHSGADANLVAYWAILSARIQAPFLNNLDIKDPSRLSASDWDKLRTELGEQVLLGMNYYSGGHLTHGYRHNFSSRMFRSFSYDVDRKTNLIDYGKVRDQAKETRPLILLAGYSAYPRNINFRIFREIADEVGAVLMVDMAHFAGLVAGGVMANDYNPVAHADIVTTTTHKTLRGPRGGMVLSSKEFADHVDKGCPLVLGGPLPHVIAAKAVGLQENTTEDFRGYARRVVQNASALADACVAEGMDVLTGGTDNHLMLLNTTPFGLTGRQAESAVREINITLNRNSLPFDSNGPWYTSGLRIGTPALTTLGAGLAEMQEIASILKLVLSNTHPTKITKGENKGSFSKSRFSTDQNALIEARTRTTVLTERFPVYPELDLDYLQQHIG